MTTNEIVYTVLDSKKADGFGLRSCGPNGVDDGGAGDDISLKHGFDRSPYDAVALRAALGSLFLGVAVGMYVFVTRIVVASRQQRRENEVGLFSSDRSEAPP